MTTEPLLATCWTTAGDASPDRADLRSPVPLLERVVAASAAGFTSMGLLLEDLHEAKGTYGAVGVRAILADHGMELREIELLLDWWATGPERAASDEVRREMLAAVEEFGIHHLKIGPDTSGAPWELEHWAAEFATLAAQTADVGARLAIEFLPWANIDSLQVGLDLVEMAAHPAGGLIIDAWHIERANTPVADVATVPGDRIVGVELNDARAVQVGTMFEDTVRRRLLCGDGDFDLTGLIAALRTAGWHGPWGVEILSDEHRKLHVAEAAEEAARSARLLLDGSDA